jgi:hypothetical protein
MPDYLSQRQNAITQDPAEKTALNTYLECQSAFKNCTPKHMKTL